MSQLTNGQRAMGVKFNPSNLPAVDEAKQGFAALYDQIEAHKPYGEGNPDPDRTMTAELERDAKSALRAAQMASVKYLTGACKLNLSPLNSTCRKVKVSARYVLCT